MFLTNYSDIPVKSPIKRFVRHWVLEMLSASRLYPSSSRPRIQFLCFHHLFDDEVKYLRNLIVVLQKEYVFISYSEAVEKIVNNTIDKPYLCFSSDDGFKNNIIAAKIFAEFNISICYFICPQIIGSDYLHTKAFCESKLHLPAVEFLNWHDVETLLAMGHEIGSHTNNHFNLAESSDTVLQEELYSSREILVSKLGKAQHFAYPYGRYNCFTKTGQKMVYEAGYSSCASAERGCHVPQQSAPAHGDLLLRRDHIIFKWKSEQIRFFLNRNVASSKYQGNDFPLL
jgi:peptidoglycan/xylan/chitin deacetylase (PgdA/CDA1 family)